MIGSELFRETLSRPSGAPTATAALSRPQPGITVCTVTGAVNPDTTPILRKALAEGRQDDNAHLVIDLSTVTSLDSSGLHTLLEARHKHRLNGGGHLAVVVDANSQAIPQLHIVVLQATFDLHHKLTEALHACASTGTDGSKPNRRQGDGAVEEDRC